MKENILIILGVLILASLVCQWNTNRYEVVSGSNMLTILVDKKTGDTWRNCICSPDSNVPGCWEKMVTLNAESFNKPQGEAKTMKKMMKIQKKQASKNSKSNEKK